MPWDQETSRHGQSEQDGIRNMCRLLRGGVQSKYRGSSELVFKYGGPVSKSTVKPYSKVPRAIAPYYRDFCPGSMQAHLKLEEVRMLRTGALSNGGAALSWPVEAGIDAQFRRAEKQKKACVTVVDHRPPHQIPIPSHRTTDRSDAPRWRRRSANSQTETALTVQADDGQLAAHASIEQLLLDCHDVSSVVSKLTQSDLSR